MSHRPLHCKHHATDVHVECVIKMVLGRGVQRRELRDAGRGDEDIQPACLCLDGVEQSIEIARTGHVALDCFDAAADQCNGFIELSLAAASDKNISAFPSKASGYRKTNTAIAPSNNRCLSFKFQHSSLLVV